jgi:hypothetical protein
LLSIPAADDRSCPQRFGLNNVFDFDGGSISALLWSQGISAAIFGLVLGKREDLNTLCAPSAQPACLAAYADAYEEQQIPPDLDRSFRWYVARLPVACISLPARDSPACHLICVAGFAGSINSFSGWMLQTFIAFSNFNDYNRGTFQNVRPAVPAASHLAGAG